jgi:undecaprenyl-diphosphatase
MVIPLPEALLLGAVQGITEILPLSSDGHLALVQMLLGSEPSLATSMLLHLGTLAATAVALRKRATNALAEGVRGLTHPSLLKDTQGGRDAVAVLFATLPTAVVGLALRSPADAWSSSPSMVGVCLLLSALALGSTYWAPRGERDSPTAWGAVLVGVAQGAAVLPGLSRSATTLAVLLWLGLRGERAFELSFLMSLPAACGAELLYGRQAFESEGGGTALVLGTLCAFILGLGALRILRGVLARRLLPLFALYLLPLAFATVAWGYARP